MRFKQATDELRGEKQYELDKMFELDEILEICSMDIEEIKITNQNYVILFRVT